MSIYNKNQDENISTALSEEKKEDKILTELSYREATGISHSGSEHQVLTKDPSFTDFTVSSVGPQNDNLPLQPVDWPMPHNIIGGDPYDCWYGDPQSIIYDPSSRLYYHWSICRNGTGFPSDWWEWVSKDAVSWNLKGVRLDRKRDTNYAPKSSFMGGSVIISDGKHGVPAGELIYCVSMQAWTDDNGRYSADQNTAIMVARGFGQNVYNKTILCPNQRPGNDSRDPFLFYADGNLYLAIASANHNDWSGIDIYKIDNLKDYYDKLELVQIIKARDWIAYDGSWRRGPSISGTEVPNIVSLSNGYWLIAYSDQYQRDGKYGYPYQSCKGWLCTRSNGQFVLQSEVQLDFGWDCYARRISNVDGKTGGRVLSQAMVFNWGFTDWSTGKGIMDWTKGYTGSSGVVELFVARDRDRRYSLRLKALDNRRMMDKYDRGAVKRILPWEAGSGNNTVRFAYGNAPQGGNLIASGNCDPYTRWPTDPVFNFSTSDEIVCLQNKNTVKLQNLSKGWEFVALIKNR